MTVILLAGENTFSLLTSKLSAKPYLLSSNLTALPKPNGKGIRPIAVGEVLYRLAAFRLQKLTCNLSSSELKPIQLGVGVSGGCENIIHNLQHLLEDNNKPVAVLSIDCKNAFNSIDRSAVIKTLFDLPELNKLWRLVHWAYSAPSDLFIRDNSGNLYPGIQSATGVRQGDPLGPVLYALGVKSIYSEALAVNPTKTVNGSAILDDFNIVGPPGDLIPVYNKFVELAAKINLEVQPSKCQLIYFHNVTNPLDKEVNEFVQTNNISLQTEAALILGAPVALNKAAAEPILQSIIDEHNIYFDALKHSSLSVQKTILLLRHCGIPRFSYLIRCVRPEFISEFIEIFDQMIISIANAKLELPSILDSMLKDYLTSQFSIPVNSGSLGLTQLSFIHNIAYISSLAHTIHLNNGLKAFEGYTQTPSSLPDDSALNLSVQAALNKIKSLISASLNKDDIGKLLPLKSKRFFTHFKPIDSGLIITAKLQSLLTKLYQQSNVETFRKKLDLNNKYEQARINAITAEGSNLF